MTVDARVSRFFLIPYAISYAQCYMHPLVQSQPHDVLARPWSKTLFQRLDNRLGRAERMNGRCRPELSTERRPAEAMGRRERFSRTLYMPYAPNCAPGHPLSPTAVC